MPVARPADISSSPDVVWTPGEAAEYLRVTEIQLSGMRCAGTGPTYSKIGRRVRYLRSDVIEWLREQRRTGTSDDAPRPAS